MKREVKKIVFEILEKDEYARENDNYLIICVISRLEPHLIGGALKNLQHSNLCLEGITRARRKFFEKNPELRPKEKTMIREQEEQEYAFEYGNRSGNHIPRID